MHSFFERPTMPVNETLPLRRLCEVTLPEHTLEILQLLSRESLQKRTTSASIISTHKQNLTTSQLREKNCTTHLDVHMPSILPRLFKVTQHRFHALAHHPRVRRRLARQRRQHSRQPRRRRARVGKGLHQRSQAKHGGVSR